MFSVITMASSTTSPTASTTASMESTLMELSLITHLDVYKRQIKDHPIYYAGPAKTPQGMACGSMGPTTAGRMDPYVDLFQRDVYKRQGLKIKKLTEK